MSLCVPYDDTPGGEIDPPGECRGRKEEIDSPLTKPLLNAVLVRTRESGVVEPDTVDHRLPELRVLEGIGLLVGVVVAAHTHSDVPFGEFVTSFLRSLHRVLAGGDEYQRLSVLADMFLREVERPVEPAILVREGVLAVTVDGDIRLQRHRPVRITKRKRRLVRRVEPLGDIIDVAHRRREGDHTQVTETAQPRDCHLKDTPPTVGIQQVHLVDYTAVHVPDELVAV